MKVDELQPMIGLEVHCQLQTQTRLFSPGPVDGDAGPNSRNTAYDIGMPGTLPVVNRRAVGLAIRAGVALQCTIHSKSRFDRKHYFYPDLPKGYQITQYHRPLCTEGRLEFDHDDTEQRLDIRRIHLEEDAAKSIHETGEETTLVDYNRAGVPLIEIVTEPQLESPEEAEAALRALHRLVVHLEVCDGNLQEGSFRCDANLSLCRRHSNGQPESVGPRIELKNLNSFRFVRRALAAEVQRLRRRIQQDGTDHSDETRLYDPDRDRTVSMRTKEASPDYRYLPDPDLPVLHVDYGRLERVRHALPELPRRRRQRYIEQLGLPADDAETLVDPPQRARFFERAVDEYPTNPQAVASFIVNELLAHVDTDGLGSLDVTPADIAEIVALCDDDVISSSAASPVLEELIAGGDEPEAIVDRLELRQLGDSADLEELIDEVLEEHPELVTRYRNGEQKLFGHFMGQVMQASSGRADPQKSSRILREKLGNQ